MFIRPIRKIFVLGLLAITSIIGYGSCRPEILHVPDGEANINNSSILRIATKIVQPFVFKHDASGEWDGFSLDFIKLVIPKMVNYTAYTMLEFENNNEIFKAVLRGEAHIGHASITKNQERERFIDFSHTFFDSGFQVMVHNNLDVAASTMKFLSNFFTTVLLQGVIAFIIIWFICSVLIWIVDFLYSGDKNVRSLFRPEFGIGIRQAMIWTVSKFGGKSVDTPRNRIGMALSFVYDLIGIFIKALITAGITVVLSKNTSTPKINGADDLPGNTVGTVVATTSQDYLESVVGVTMKNYASVGSMFTGFYDADVDALVYDYPILVFNLQQRQIQLGLDDARIVGEIFEKQPYGIAIKPGENILRENLNQGILAVMDEGNDYERIHNKWFSFNQDASISETDFEVSFIFLGGLGALFLVLLIMIFCCYKVKQYRDVRKSNEEINIADMIKNEKSWKKKLELLQGDIEEDKYLSNAAMNEKGFLITRDIQEMLFQLNDNIQEGINGGVIKPLQVNEKLLRKRRRNNEKTRTIKERHNLSMEDKFANARQIITPDSGMVDGSEITKYSPDSNDGGGGGGEGDSGKSVRGEGSDGKSGEGGEVTIDIDNVELVEQTDDVKQTEDTIDEEKEEDVEEEMKDVEEEVKNVVEEIKDVVEGVKERENVDEANT